MILYQNKFYKVFHRSGMSEYVVINKITNVVEDRTNKLPTAVGSAIAMEAAINKFIAEEERLGKEQTSSN